MAPPQTKALDAAAPRSDVKFSGGLRETRRTALNRCREVRFRAAKSVGARTQRFRADLGALRHVSFVGCGILWVERTVDGDPAGPRHFRDHCTHGSAAVIPGHH